MCPDEKYNSISYPLWDNAVFVVGTAGNIRIYDLLDKSVDRIAVITFNSLCILLSQKS